MRTAPTLQGSLPHILGRMTTPSQQAPPPPDPAYHGPLVPTPKSGEEQIRGDLLGFWRWAYSQTLDNALRGVLAEYLVGLALGGPDRDARVEWDA